MPVPSSLVSPQTHSYSHPTYIPTHILDTLRRDIQTECSANIILAHLFKCIEKERQGRSLAPNQVWITCQRGGKLDFVLSCTEGPMGRYPIFIFAAVPFNQLLDPNYTRSGVAALIQELRRAGIGNERIFSVFAPEPVTHAFAGIWTDITGVPLARAPAYYAAQLSYCTAASFVDTKTALKDTFTFLLRPAVEEDVPITAELCRLFSGTSPPFLLDFDQALEEAKIMVRDRKMWVHEIRQGNGPPDIASIVAFTRNTPNVAAITKVYTNPRWRNKGCAVRLVRAVTKHLLKTKEAVVLYVAHENPAARVYDQVGFVGLRGDAHEYPGADRWLELGFDPRFVDLGHW